MCPPGGATIVTRINKTNQKRAARLLEVKQSAIWQNWIPIENLGPSNLADAPVLLTVGPKNYWMFGRYGRGTPRRQKGKKQKAKQQEAFVPQIAKLEGFDVPLKTTRFPNQYDAPGGRGIGFNLRAGFSEF